MTTVLYSMTEVLVDPIPFPERGKEGENPLALSDTLLSHHNSSSQVQDELCDLDNVDRSHSNET